MNDTAEIDVHPFTGEPWSAIVADTLETETRRTAGAYDAKGNYIAADPRELKLLAAHQRRNKLQEARALRMVATIDSIESRRFNFAEPPPEPKPRFLLQGKSICTPGNLTAIMAQAKAGKSAFIGAMIASTLVADSREQSADCLGLTADREAGGVVLHLDTEQTPGDHDGLIRTAMRRAYWDAADPAWLVTYALAGMASHEQLDILRALVPWHSALHGLHSVIIDGVADLCRDVNDADAVNALVAELHGLAIKHSAPFICVLHENPAQDTGKARGHLGSQLERKAESNLRLKKTEQVTVVFSEKMRRAPIIEAEGPRFRWSDEHRMHVSCETVANAKDAAKRAKLWDQAEALFQLSGSIALTWTQVRNAIVKSEDLGQSGARKRLEAMQGAKVIIKDAMGLWRLASK